MELLDEGDVRSLLAFLDTLDAPAPPPALEDAEPRAEPVRSPAHGASSGESPRSPSESERSSSSAGSPSSGSSDSIGQGPAAPQQQQVKKKKKKRNPATSSTALQRRKREEIQALRDESAALEQQLRQLKRVHAAGAAAQSAAQSVVGAKRRAGPARSVWQELAILQARERHRAEITNRKLKAVLANQQEVNDALQGLVGKRSVLQDMGSILDEKPLYRTPVQVDCAPSVIDMLEKQVEAMYISMERPVADSPPSTVSSTTELLRTPAHGQTIQVVTTTPLGCSMEETADMLWTNMTTKRVYPDKAYNFFRRVNNEAIEKNFVMLVRDTDMNFQVNGLQFMRKYVEKDRVVIIRTDLMLLPTNSLRFRDRVWTTISRANYGQRNGSVVHVRYQVNAETDDDFEANSADLSYAQQFLMQRLSSNSRAYEQALQSQLITEDLRRRSGAQAAF